MEFSPIFEKDAALVGLGIRAILAGTAGKGVDQVAERLTLAGVIVDPVGDVFTAMSALIDDPADYALLVVRVASGEQVEDLERNLRRLGDLRRRIPVIIISEDCREQAFPNDRAEAIRLRAPLSAVSLRVALEHGLRDRVMWRIAA
ncbi:hypothetical protein E7811_03815 [Aliigemmobacter aestuarii]|uniref:Uncharacterized protein n=1 Tax=Aliigemmobacter aestuarii TaxID=1445661 RepID=A0A4V3V0Q5_9RHOB|nr:hypothetical protein [Gemmobacter aestuarii]THD84862.1 hypothetical protein E7811_03815 [Gemmobacter aestuarii]